MDFLSTCGADNIQGIKKNLPGLNYLYNPFEIALVGDINSEKNRKFINHLIRKLSLKLNVGIVQFEKSEGILEKNIDASYEETEARAVSTLVVGETEYRLSRTGTVNTYERSRYLIDVDMVLILSEETIPNVAKIIFQNDDPKRTVKNKPDTALENVIAVYGNGPFGTELSSGAIPCVAREDIAGIKEIVDGYFRKEIDRIPLFGLVLTGGKSTRMKRDKSSLQYHSKPQSEYCDDLLSQFCDEVYLSNRKEQRSDRGQKDLPQIHDTFNDLGPMGGILTALHTRPDNAWLVLACDLPFIDVETITNLIEHRNPSKMATAYTSIHDGFPEPLCAIYEPKSIHRLLYFLGLGYKCPRKVLINSDVHLLDPVNDKALENVNTIDDYRQVLEQIKSF